MAFDLKIVNGTVIDGTGAPGRQANVAVSGGIVVEVGECSGSATTVIDAGGAVVTPGFVDLHAHYDGQVSWDSDMAPSSVHGVTTCVIGNCGVGFAPVRPADHDRLIRLMEGVEDIPGSALAEGIRWGWESFPEYMRVIDAMPHAIDIAMQVPHDALRLYVMGDRGEAREEATDADIEAMRRLLREGLEAGAIGFSTGRSDNHRSADGKDTPASISTARELTGLARAFDGLSHGVLQAVSDFDMALGPDRFDGEFDVVEAMAAAAGGHSTCLSLMQRDMAPDQWQRILKRVEAANARNVPMRVQVAPRAIGVLLGLEATFHPFIGFPSYKAIAHLPLSERVRQMRDPAFKTRILGETSEPLAGDGSAIPPLADQLLSRLDFVSMRLFRLGERPDYEPTLDQSLCAEAQRKGITPLEAMYDALLEGDGRELLYFPLLNYTEFSLDNVATMMAHPLSLLGLADGGAHVGTVCDASMPTFFLMHWTRDRARGKIPIERAIAMLTSAPAGYLGLADRGVVAAGRRADLNVLDLGAMRLHRPRLVADLPAGGKRLMQDADGYRATIVAGRVIAKNGALTGERPGHVVRAGVAER